MNESAKGQAASIRAKLKLTTAEAFVEKYAEHTSRRGIFMKTPEPRAVGTPVKFEFLLADGTPVFRGMGEVVWARQTEAPGKPKGMGVKFTKLSPHSQELLDKIAEMQLIAGIDEPLDPEFVAALRDSEAAAPAVPEVAPVTKEASAPPLPVAPAALVGSEDKEPEDEDAAAKKRKKPSVKVDGFDMGAIDSMLAGLASDAPPVVRRTKRRSFPPPPLAPEPEQTAPLPVPAPPAVQAAPPSTPPPEQTAPLPVPAPPAVQAAPPSPPPPSVEALPRPLPVSKAPLPKPASQAPREDHDATPQIPTPRLPKRSSTPPPVPQAAMRRGAEKSDVSQLPLPRPTAPPGRPSYATPPLPLATAPRSLLQPSTPPAIDEDELIAAPEDLRASEPPTVAGTDMSDLAAQVFFETREGGEDVEKAYRDRTAGAEVGRDVMPTLRVDALTKELADDLGGRGETVSRPEASRPSNARKAAPWPTGDDIFGTSEEELEEEIEEEIEEELEELPSEKSEAEALLDEITGAGFRALAKPSAAPRAKPSFGPAPVEVSSLKTFDEEEFEAIGAVFEEPSPVDPITDSSDDRLPMEEVAMGEAEIPLYDSMAQATSMSPELRTERLAAPEIEVEIEAEAAPEERGSAFNPNPAAPDTLPDDALPPGLVVRPKAPPQKRPLAPPPKPPPSHALYGQGGQAPKGAEIPVPEAPSWSEEDGETRIKKGFFKKLFGN